MSTVSVSPAEVVLRAATAADAEAMASIYSYYVDNTVITFEENPVPASEILQRLAVIQSGGLPWLVAERDGQVAGYSYASPWKTRSAYRHSVEATIYLRQGMQGRGIGKALYSALFPLLRERGVHAVIGGAALPNSASASLHEALGFEPVGTFRQVGFKHGRWVDVAYWQKLL